MFIKNDHSLRLLDFARIRSSVAGYCLSEEGSTLLELEYPVADSSLLESAKKEVMTLVSLLETSELPAFSFPPVETFLKRLAVEGMALELPELYAIGVWTREYDKLCVWMGKAYGGQSQSGLRSDSLLELSESLDLFADFDSLAVGWATFHTRELLNGAPKLHDVYKIISEVITPDGEMRDLPELRKLKDSIARANKDLISIAESYRQDPDLRSALQSDEPTQRDGRTVLAVRANFRGRIKGIVHEVSATGQTVFIEPSALVEKNNDLVQLEARLKAEIFRILKETAARIRQYVPAMKTARKILALLDGALARAIQCRREELHFAEACGSGFTIWRARHPLLGKKAVPIDVDLPESTRTLIVTGPNTGGKTVTLKTIGLFSLMNQMAFGLPAAQGTKLPVFGSVLADIGDEQSIDQSLSTFSGHMKVISDIVKAAGGSSLVLLDELGAGTDPEEGCAIAMGLLDFFIEKGSLTIATTHHGILKNYGYTKPACLNASMEFDSARLAPTYRIVMGIPGESRALEIAAQTGLAQDIVANARRYLAEERTDIGELIAGLNEKHRELERLEREQRLRIKEAAEDQRKADLAALRVKQKETELRRHGLMELKSLLSESRKTLENLVRELRESGATTDRTKEVKNFLAELSDSVERQYSVLESEASVARSLETGVARSLETDKRQADAESAREPSNSPAVRSKKGVIKTGSEVLYGPSKKKAIVIRRSGAGRWIVEVGSVRLSAEESELVLADSSRPLPPRIDIELAPPGEGESPIKASFELDLRGFRLGEALKSVEKQIDAASLQGLTLFSIVHGTGEGILGKGIHEYLRSNPSVQDYHFARPEEGGYGKTVVRLKA